MPVSPFFSTPYEYGRTHADPATALDAAERLVADSFVDPDDTSRRILHGLAVRDDLTDAHVARIIALTTNHGWTIRAALITNPALRHSAAVSRLFTSENVAFFLLRDDVLDYADQIIEHCPGPRRGSDMPEADYYATIRRVLGEQTIEDYFSRILVASDAAGLRTLARHPLLTATGFTAVLAIAGSPDTGLSLVRDVITSLCQRDDLTPEQALALVATIKVVSRRARGSERWLLATLVMNRQAPVEVMTKLVTHCSAWIRNLVLSQDHVRPETLHAAACAHLPHAVMRLGMGNLPSPVAHAVLSDLEAGTARGHVLSDEETSRFVAAVVRHSEDPAVWDRALPLFDSPARSSTGGHSSALTFYDAAATNRGARNLFHHASVARMERLHTWMSTHPNPDLRALLVPGLYLTEQVAAAAGDPAAQVRAAAVRHPLATPALLSDLVRDPSPLVRVSVAEHDAADRDILTALSDDPDPLVRAAAAEAFLSALTT